MHHHAAWLSRTPNVPDHFDLTRGWSDQVSAILSLEVLSKLTCAHVTGIACLANIVNVTKRVCGLSVHTENESKRQVEAYLVP